MMIYFCVASFAHDFKFRANEMLEHKTGKLLARPKILVPFAKCL